MGEDFTEIGTLPAFFLCRLIEFEFVFFFFAFPGKEVDSRLLSGHKIIFFSS